MTDISDHFPVLTCMGKRDDHRKKDPLSFTTRKMGPNEIQKISESLKYFDWDQMFSQNGVDECYNNFIDYLTVLLDTHAPLTVTTIPHRSIIREDWMTSALIKSSKKKEILYARAVGYPRESSEYTKYTKYANTFNTLKRQAKQSHYRQLLREYSQDIRKSCR